MGNLSYVDRGILLEKFYNDEVPDYIDTATKTSMKIWVDGKKHKITLEDVVVYYARQATNILNGCRTLAGITGDWRNIDYLAKECLEYFKFCNVATLRKVAKKYGLEPKF